MLRTAIAAALGLALLAVPGLAQAQLELKPAIGLTVTSVSKDPVNGKVTGQVGYQLGATVLFGEALYFEGGLFYAKKSLAVTDISTSTKFEPGITGLRIPVMVGYHIIGAPKDFLSLRIFGGGSAFLVTSVNADAGTKADFTSPTYGVFAGAGVDVLFLFADLQYEWSLSKLSKITAADVGQSRSFYANAGVKIVF
jgi:hypothetical protein